MFRFCICIKKPKITPNSSTKEPYKETDKQHHKELDTTTIQRITDVMFKNNIIHQKIESKEQLRNYVLADDAYDLIKHEVKYLNRAIRLNDIDDVKNIINVICIDLKDIFDKGYYPKELIHNLIEYHCPEILQEFNVYKHISYIGGHKLVSTLLKESYKLLEKQELYKFMVSMLLAFKDIYLKVASIEITDLFRYALENPSNIIYRNIIKCYVKSCSEENISKVKDITPEMCVYIKDVRDGCV